MSFVQSNQTPRLSEQQATQPSGETLVGAAGAFAALRLQADAPADAKVNAPKELSLFAVVVVLAYLFTVAGGCLARLGYDWGYYLVAQLVGQPQSGQWFGSIVLGVFLIPACALGFALGYAEFQFGRWYYWRLLAPFAVVGLHFIAAGAQLRDLDGNLVYSLLPVVPWQVALFAGSYAAARKCASELAQRVNAVALLSTIAIALAAGAFVEFSTLVHAWAAELGIYAAALFATGWMSSAVIRLSKPAAGFSAAFFATLPVTVFNAVNIAFTAVSLLSGGDLGWRAVFSAFLIALVTLFAASLGGWLSAMAKLFYRRC